MHFTSSGLPIAAFLSTFVGLLASTTYGGEPTTATPTGRAITRVFIQDPEKLTLMWADLLAQQPPAFSAAKPVEGFPPLDPQRQSLVQMAVSAGKIMVGVRDDEDGVFQSGWASLDSGVARRRHPITRAWPRDRANAVPWADRVPLS